MLRDPLEKIAGTNSHVLIFANETAVFIANEGLELVGNSVFEREQGGDGGVVGKYKSDVQLWERGIEEFL